MHGAASIAQLVEHALRKRTVVGSIPTGGFFNTLFFFTPLACLLQPNLQQTQQFEAKLSMFCHGQFARVVKGVDLRSTAGNCAWVRTPQLTFAMLEVFMVLPSCERKNMKSMLVSIRGGRPKQCDATRYGKLGGSIP